MGEIRQVTEVQVVGNGRIKAIVSGWGRYPQNLFLPDGTPEPTAGGSYHAEISRGDRKQGGKGDGSKEWDYWPVVDQWNIEPPAPVYGADGEAAGVKDMQEPASRPYVDPYDAKDAARDYSIKSQTALKAAVDSAGAGAESGDVLEVAWHYLQWLTSPYGPEGAPEADTETAPARPPVTQEQQFEELGGGTW